MVIRQWLGRGAGQEEVYGGMTYTFFNSKIDNGVNEGLNWFGIYLMVSLQDITQNMFCNLAKISHLADLKIC